MRWHCCVFHARKSTFWWARVKGWFSLLRSVNHYNQNGESIPDHPVMYRDVQALWCTNIIMDMLTHDSANLSRVWRPPWRRLVARRFSRPLINLIGPHLLTDGCSAMLAESTSHSVYGFGVGSVTASGTLSSLVACSCTQHWLVKCFRLRVMYATPTHTAHSIQRCTPTPWYYCRHHYTHLSKALLVVYCHDPTVG